jgi:protein-S-isoprenylcysteine O-methyltransferase Ste14
MRTTDYADVTVKPPLLFGGALALGYVLSLYLPLGPGLASPNALALTVGLLFIAGGFALAIFSVRAFRRAGTNLVPGQPATTLVTTGPYRITRDSCLSISASPSC